MRALHLLIAFLMLLPCVPEAKAVIVNLDGVYNCANNPVVVPFGAGTYQVEPIGIADGGMYDALSAHNGEPGTWIYAYWIESNSLDLIAFSIGWRDTAAHALTDALGTSFTLPTSDDVSFHISDGPMSEGAHGYSYRYDNVGGISLLVSGGTIPAPGAVVLASTGMGLFGWLRRRKAI